MLAGSQKSHKLFFFSLWIFHFLPDYTFISSSRHEAVASSLWFLWVILEAGKGKKTTNMLVLLSKEGAWAQEFCPGRPYCFATSVQTGLC